MNETPELGGPPARYLRAEWKGRTWGQRRRYVVFWKRILDLCVVVAGAPVWLPVSAATMAAVWMAMGRPLLLRQRRPGRAGRPFELLKFRTMKNAIGSDGRLLPDDQRLTRFGKALRSTSLDELPELWNVLRGDMSVVGPRPLLMEYLPLYSKRQARRHDVMPGITGWAQVNGRNALSWERKLELDVWYVENLSFGLDLRILWRTLAAVVRRQGISAVGEATMPRFKGSAS